LDRDKVLLRHAITPPKFEEDWLHRERLVDRIHGIVPSKLITISAPFGSGKTTLLADFTAHTDLPVCWVRLTKMDSDVVRLASVLAASLANRFPQLEGKYTTAILSETDAVSLARIFASVLGEEIDTPTVIIMDDAHVIDWSQETKSFIGELVSGPVEQITLILSGRSTPRLTVTTLMQLGGVEHLGPRELNFNADEVTKLAELQYGIDVKSGLAKRIMAVTGGWSMGITLSLRAAKDETGKASRIKIPDVQQYLIDEAFREQPEEIQQFMLESSVMPIMSAELCDEVLQRKDSERILNEMVSNGMFIVASGEEHQTYEYHPQFHEILIRELEKADPDRLRDLRIRAADHYFDSGLIEHALELHLQAGNLDQAVSMAENAAKHMLTSGRQHTLENWADSLRDQQADIPMVLICHATAVVLNGDVDGCGRVLKEAKKCITRRTHKDIQAFYQCMLCVYHYSVGEYKQGIEATENALALLVEKSPRWLKGMILWMRGLCELRGFGDHEQAQRLIKDADLITQGEDEPLVRSMILSALSTAQERSGRIMEAYQTALKAYHEAPQHQLVSVSLRAKLAVARMANLVGNLEESLQLMEEVLRDARNAGSMLRECEALIEKGGFLSDLGVLDQAEEHLRQGYELAVQCNESGKMMDAILRLVRLCYRQGNINRQMEWLDTSPSAVASVFGAAGLHIERAALRMQMDPSTCEDEIEHSYGQDHLNTKQLVLLEILSIRCALHHGEREKAISLMEKLISTANLTGQMHQLATELSYSSELVELARGAFEGSATIAEIDHRLKSMRQAANRIRAHARKPVSTPSQLSIHLLGRIESHFAGESLEKLKPRALHVLYYLVDRGYENRDILLEKFWPNQAPGKAITNLHSHVYSLRRKIGNKAIELEGIIYRINADLQIRYDVAEFEEAKAEADRVSKADPRRFELLKRALDHYNGPFMPGRQEAWVLTRRERLEESYLDILVEYAKEALLRNLPLEGLRSARKALRINELREDVNVLLIEALGRLGRQSELDKHYRRYIQMLKDDLGIAPAGIVEDAFDRWSSELSKYSEGD
jgi:ATP/maltotriose-dependent transcriptional regulator MalT